MYGPWESNEEGTEWFRRNTKTGKKSAEVRRVAWLGNELRVAWKWSWGASAGRCASLADAQAAVDAELREYLSRNHPSGLYWWTVFDREMPWEGAHVVLARDEDEAREIGHYKWYQEIGEFMDHMGAVLLPIPVTDDQIIHQYGEDVLKATVEWYEADQDYIHALSEQGVEPLDRLPLIEKWRGENPRPDLGFKL